jgi:threonine dehydratase
LKCESFQRAGAFKFRGAFNTLSQMAAKGVTGVLTFSSGNHAAALALAGQILGVHVVVVMPSDAPKIKLDATRGYGAEVILYRRDELSREDLGRQLSEERGLEVVHPYDDPRIVAGAGTAAKELFEEIGALDLLVVPCGGGGLLSGSALSASALAPGCEVWAVEPSAGDDGKRSFESGQLQTVSNPETIADGARTPYLGQNVTFPLIKHLVKGFVTVSDDELLSATRFVWERMKLVIEPTAALGIASLLSKRIDGEGRRVGVMISGGNVDVVALGQRFSSFG